MTTMNLSFLFLLVAMDARSNLVPEMRLKCDWIMGPWVSTGLMSSSAHSFTISVPIDTSFTRSLALVDADGTLHAQLDVRLTQYMPPTQTVSPDQSDTWSQVSSAVGTLASSSNSDTSRAPVDTPRTFFGKNKRNGKANDPDKPVFTSLRRGGR